MYLIAICSCGQQVFCKGRNKGSTLYVSSKDLEEVLKHFRNKVHTMVWAEDVIICSK